MLKKKVPVLLLTCSLLLTGCAGTAGTGNQKEAKMFKKTPDNDKTITVSYANRSLTNNSTFEGFGTALCWWANRIGYSDTLSEQAAELFYGQDGLRFNILRYNIGGGDDPTHHHIKRTDSEVPGWLYLKDDGSKAYDYNADARQLNVLSRCYQKAVSPYVEVFSNSAPYFMTESGCASGAVISSDNNLKPECYEEFGEYLATVAEYINNDLAITVNSVSPMNEPDTNYWGAMSEKQEGSHADPGDVQSAILVVTAKAFKNHNLTDVEIIPCEETSTVKTVNSYKLLSDEARSVIGRVSTHTYDTTGIKSLGGLQKSEGFNLWMSEVDGDGSLGKNPGEMGSALYFADKIITDINDLGPSAWVMWQAIDNHISKEGFNGNSDSGMVNVNKGFWGLAVADHDNENIILTQKYYSMGQFSRYINAGDTLIITDSSTSLAAYDSNEKTLTIVSYNSDENNKTFFYDIKGFKSTGNVTVIRTSGSVANGEHWDEVDSFPISSWNGAYELPSYSISTLIITDVEPK